MDPQRWRKVKELFQAAVVRPPGDRAAFVAEMCNGDDDLRHETSRLLEAHDKTGDFIERPAFELAPELLVEDAAPGLIGRTFGHYRVESELGVGGMGEVYLAHDERLHRNVALKFLPARFTKDPILNERFRQEAQTVSALNHPNIVTIHEIGEVNGSQFMATEFVDGMTLRQRMDEGAVSLREALEIAIQIGSALSAAHGAGIVHRDIKPENVMVRADGYVKVLDFGIAKLTERQRAASPRPGQTPLMRTQEGVTVGTPFYMSPEQARNEELDGRSDIWSLGVILFEMLTRGERPFSGGSNADVMAAVLRSDPRPLDRSVPAEIRRVIARCLAKDRGARYQNAIDLRADLQKALASLASAARHAWRNAAIAALLILGLGGLWWWQRSSHSGFGDKESIAVLPFQNLSPDPNDLYLAQGIQDEILTRLSKIGRLKVISRTSTEKYKGTVGNMREIGRELDVANLVEGNVQKIANTVKINVQLIRADRDEHLWGESYNRSLNDILGIEGEVASAISQQLNVKLTGAEEKALASRPTQNAAAYEAYLRGIALGDTTTSSNLPAMQSAAQLEEAVKLDPKFALAWARLAVLRSFLSSYGVDPGANTPAIAKAAVDQARALDPNSGESWVAQGAYLYRVARDYPAALEAYHEALKYLPNDAHALEHTAFLERRLGQWDAGLSHIRQAMNLDPLTVTRYSNIAIGFLNPLRRFAEAEEALDRVLQAIPNDESTLANKAFLYEREGRLDEATRLFERIPITSRDETVLDLRPRHLAYERRFAEAAAQMQINLDLNSKPEAPLAGNRITNLTLLGYYQQWAGQSSEARNTFQSVVQAIKPSPEAVVPVTSKKLRCYLALAYAGLGEKETALTEARRAVDEYRNDQLDSALTEQTLAQVQAHFGEKDAVFAALPHLLEMPAGLTPGVLRIDPFWDPVRNEPLFAKFANPTSK